MGRGVSSWFKWLVAFRLGLKGSLRFVLVLMGRGVLFWFKWVVAFRLRINGSWRFLSS